jgi:hypothetical protein
MGKQVELLEKTLAEALTVTTVEVGAVPACGSAGRQSHAAAQRAMVNERLSAMREEFKSTKAKYEARIAKLQHRVGQMKQQLEQRELDSIASETKLHKEWATELEQVEASMAQTMDTARKQVCLANSQRCWRLAALVARVLRWASRLWSACCRALRPDGMPQVETLTGEKRALEEELERLRARVEVGQRVKCRGAMTSAPPQDLEAQVALEQTNVNTLEQQLMVAQSGATSSQVESLRAQLAALQEKVKATAAMAMNGSLTLCLRAARGRRAGAAAQAPWQRQLREYGGAQAADRRP